MRGSMKTALGRLTVGLLLIFIPWLLILAQMSGLAWLNFANATSARYFVITMMVLSSLGAGCFVTGSPNKVIIWIVVALLGQLGIFLIGGYLGLLDAQQGGIIYQENGFYYALDSMGGFNEALLGASGIITIISKAIPFIVLIWGIIGIMVSDSPDEMTTPLIETAIAIVVLAIFYWVGTYIGYI